MSESPKDVKDKEAFSLSRWSRRKHEVTRAASAPAVATPAPASAAPAPAAPVSAAPAAAEAPLPPIESLTFESDFTAFLAPKVDESVKRAALKKLFSDPRFNVMDGLDVYIDDYSKPDPMPEGMLAKLKDIYETIADDAKEQVAEAPDDVKPEETKVAEAPPAEPAAKEPDESRG